jgi:WD40 repeat protein
MTEALHVVKIAGIALLMIALMLGQPAQDDLPQWSLSRECADDPVARPEGWTFAGIIASIVPDDGIRGLRADTFKTYYLAFAGSNFIEGGALSPDGRFLAVPYGYIETAGTLDVRYKVNELRIISTEAFPQIRARIGWQATFQHPNIPQVLWLDDETLLFPQGSFLDGLSPQRVKPFTNEVMPDTVLMGMRFSPDLTRAFSPDYDSWGLFDLSSGAVLARYPTLPLAWSPDSSLFARVSDTGMERWLQLVDREGQLLANAADITPDRRLWNFRWSPDGSKFVYSAYDPYKNENTLYIGDMTTQTVTDACVLLVNRHDGEHESGVVWSPDGTQLALLTSQATDDPNALQILNVETGERYSIGVYAGGLMGWGQ